MDYADQVDHEEIAAQRADAEAEGAAELAAEARGEDFTQEPASGEVGPMPAWMSGDDDAAGD